MRQTSLTLTFVGGGLLLMAAAALALPAGSVQLDKPIAVAFHKADNTALQGRVTQYDAAGFDLLLKNQKSSHVPWSDLDAHNIFLVRAALTPAKDGAAWIDLGRDLLPMPDGGDWANHAFDRAIRIDPALKSQVEQARKDAASPPSAAPPDTAGVAMIPGGVGVPRTIGTAQDKFWGPQSDADQADQVAQLKAFADAAAAKLNRPLHAQETKYFLFYSDLPPNEAANWAGLLDRMYVRLADLFAVPKGQNIWRGKALILVFSNANDYRRYESEIQNTEAGSSVGMTHCYGDGLVHIAFFRQPDELTFAHVLVHESVHGFLHRYRSPVPITSWINEGLAEIIAAELVPEPRRAAFIPGLARAGLSSHQGRLNTFFTLDHIEAWQYPVAETLTGFMIRQNKKNYVDFINGIKDDLPWQESLDKKYKVPLERLVNAYGRSLGEKATSQ